MAFASSLILYPPRSWALITLGLPIIRLIIRPCRTYLVVSIDFKVFWLRRLAILRWGLCFRSDVRIHYISHPLTILAKPLRVIKLIPVSRSLSTNFTFVHLSYSFSLLLTGWPFQLWLRVASAFGPVSLLYGRSIRGISYWLLAIFFCPNASPLRCGVPFLTDYSMRVWDEKPRGESALHFRRPVQAAHIPSNLE